MTTVGAGDPLRLLLRDPALVLAADPCPAHRARLGFRLAALKSLGHREFLRIADGRVWNRLYARFRWLLTDEAVRSWDGQVAALAGARDPEPEEFDLMKVRANRLEIAALPIDRLLAALPSGTVDSVATVSACGADPSKVPAEVRRVLRAGREMKKTSSGVPGVFTVAGTSWTQ